MCMYHRHSFSLIVCLTKWRNSLILKSHYFVSSVLFLHVNDLNLFVGFGSDRILLRDVQVLTLKQGHMTNGRRSSPVPQVRICTGVYNMVVGPKPNLFSLTQLYIYLKLISKVLLCVRNSDKC